MYEPGNTESVTLMLSKCTKALMIVPVDGGMSFFVSEW